MKRSSIIIITFFVFCTVSVRGEYIFLEDGSIIEAVIESQTAKSLTILHKNGSSQTFLGQEILRIREKNYVRRDVSVLDFEKRTIVRTNIVDESGSRYTFRLNINSAEEYSLKKDSVLILSDSFPAKTAVTPGSRDLSLSWEGIPDAQRYVVCASADGGAYEIITESKKPSAVLTGLKGNTRYKIAVCAEDLTGKGFGPAERIAVTLNTPPTAPKLKAQTTGQSISLSWNGAQDEDGRIVSYVLYELKGDAYREVARTAEESFTVEFGDLNAVRTFAVSAVDDKNAESALSDPRRSREKKAAMYKAEVLYAHPHFSLKDDYTYGTGILLSGEWRRFIGNTFSLGTVGGIISFRGKDSAKGELFPLCLEARYSYEPFPLFRLMCSIAAGPAYYGGRINDRDFSHPASAVLLRAGIEKKIGVFIISAQAAGGGFRTSEGFRYFSGATLGAGLAVEF